MYEALLKEAEKLSVYIYEKSLKPRTKGLQADNVIWINKNMTANEKACILAEELSHYHTSYGNILDQKKLENRKQELIARRCSYRYLIPFHKIIQAWEAGVSGRYEIADFLNVTEEFLQEAICQYKSIHGPAIKYQNYIITFEPLSVKTT